LKEEMSTKKAMRDKKILKKLANLLQGKVSTFREGKDS